MFNGKQNSYAKVRSYVTGNVGQGDVSVLKRVRNAERHVVWP